MTSSSPSWVFSEVVAEFGVLCGGLLAVAVETAVIALPRFVMFRELPVIHGLTTLWLLVCNQSLVTAFIYKYSSDRRNIGHSFWVEFHRAKVQDNIFTFIICS